MISRMTDRYEDELKIYSSTAGSVYLTVTENGVSASVGPFEPDELIAAIRGEDGTVTASASAWEIAPNVLQQMWDMGEERDGKVGERYAYRREDGTCITDVLVVDLPASPRVRLCPRPQPSWQDAEVVEASLEEGGIRRRFLRGSPGWVSTSGLVYQARDLIDPEPMIVQKKEE